MPIYEYRCTGCQNEFEALVRGDERAACPSCGQTELERQLSAPSAHVRGGALPVVGKSMAAEGCGAPQCCMGRCSTGM